MKPNFCSHWGRETYIGNTTQILVDGESIWRLATGMLTVRGTMGEWTFARGMREKKI